MTLRTEPVPGVRGAVELLERALGYTRGVLVAVTDADLARPTPCAGWDLAALLAHMEDALDAFGEAAGGRVARTPVLPGAGPRVDRLQQKACALLGAWAGAPGDDPAAVDVGGHALDRGLLVSAAALEITVHGWDVGAALGPAPAVPEPLAERLLAVAGFLVQPEDRVVRFGPALAVHPTSTASERLLAHLGRRAAPAGKIPAKPRRPDATGP